MGYNYLLTNEGVTVFRRVDSSIAFMRHLKGKLYLVDFTTSKLKFGTCLAVKSSMGWLLHCRLPHFGMRNLTKLQNDEHVLGLTNVCFQKNK